MRNTLKFVICWLLYHSGILSLYLRFFFLKRPQFPVVVIYYHRFVRSHDGVLDIHPSISHPVTEFIKEIDFLKRYFYVLSLDEAADTLSKGRYFSRPAVVLTADDGYKDNYDLAFPILKENNTPFTIFLNTGVIGTDKVNWYDRLADVISGTSKKCVRSPAADDHAELPLRTLAFKRKAYLKIVRHLKYLSRKERENYLHDIEHQLGASGHDRMMLNWEEVNLMKKSDIVFGAHTHNHQILTTLPVEDAKNEIKTSKDIIEQQIKQPVNHFAYPNGRAEDFSQEHKEYCRFIGFKSVSSTITGSNHASDDVWCLKRVGAESPLCVFAVTLLRAFLK